MEKERIVQIQVDLDKRVKKVEMDQWQKYPKKQHQRWESMDRYKEFFQPEPGPQVDHKAIAERGMAHIGIGLLQNMTSLILGTAQAQAAPASPTKDDKKRKSSKDPDPSKTLSQEKPNTAGSGNPLANLFNNRGKSMAMPQSPKLSLLKPQANGGNASPADNTLKVPEITPEFRPTQQINLAALIQPKPAATKM